MNRGGVSTPLGETLVEASREDRESSEKVRAKRSPLEDVGTSCHTWAHDTVRAGAIIGTVFERGSYKF